MEPHCFWIIRTVTVVISETGSGFPFWCPTKADCCCKNFRCSDVNVHLQFWCAECLNDLIYVFISLFFSYWLKLYMYCSNLNKFLHSKIWPCDHLVKYIKLEHLFMFSQESGYNLMPYDLHPFLIFFMFCQLRRKRLKHHKTNLTMVHVYRLKHQVKHCFYFSNTWEFNLGKWNRVTTWR